VVMVTFTLSSGASTSSTPYQLNFVPTNGGGGG
jgi:hypothetical protein